MSYPDFVCMGFQKCGTTTLYEIMRKHPQVALCRDVKEPMYYRVPLMDFFGKGSQYYKKRYFGHIAPGDSRLKGEINAGLTYNGCAKKLSRDMASDTKMIFMLRDPVQRSYSAYKYFLARGFLPFHVMSDDKKYGHAVAFDHYVHSVLDGRQRKSVMKRRLKYLVFSQSNYGACISEYLSAFDKKNMKFVIFEDFVKNEHAVCREIYDFLGISDNSGTSYSVRTNDGRERINSRFFAKLYMGVKGLRYFFYDLLDLPHKKPKAYALFHRFCKWTRKKALVTDFDRSNLLPETESYLRAYFKEDVEETEKLTGLSLKKAWGWDAPWQEVKDSVYRRNRVEFRGDYGIGIGG